jgi:hypothetical protein
MKDKYLQDLNSIKDLCKTEEEFKELQKNLELFLVVADQANQIFIGSVYNENSKTLIEAAENSIADLKTLTLEKFIESSKEVGAILQIPKFEELLDWVQEIHTNIASQLFSEEFCKSVFTPALDSISKSILEFTEEEMENEVQKNNNTKG